MNEDVAYARNTESECNRSVTIERKPEYLYHKELLHIFTVKRNNDNVMMITMMMITFTEDIIKLTLKKVLY